MKIIKNTKILLVLIFTTFLFGACEWLTIAPVKVDVPDVVSFAGDIQPIFNNKCASCHISRAPVLTPGFAYNALINGSYINISTPEASPLIVKTDAGHAGGITPSERALIVKWITDGALNN
jgi:mono/diheme cytochrome c family protein